MKYPLILADRLNEQDLKLLACDLANPRHDTLTALQRAIRGIQNTNTTILMHDVVQELIQGLHSYLLPNFSRLTILRIEKLGSLGDSLFLFFPLSLFGGLLGPVIF